MCHIYQNSGTVKVGPQVSHNNSISSFRKLENWIVYDGGQGNMFIKIKYFGLITNKLDSQAVLPEDSNVADLLNHLFVQHPNNKDMLNRATILVNKSKANLNTVLHDNDEVMILAVLGGG